MAIGGAVEALLARSMHRLRALLPPELAGVVIVLIAGPGEAEVRESDDGVRLLAGFLLRHNADRASSSRRGVSVLVRFHFHH